jgi:hypothetical protein
MKTLKSLVIIVLCGMIISGCASKSDVPPHLAAVPKNASIVLALNAKQIVEKAGLNRPEQYECFSLLQQEFDGMVEEELLKNFLKDTRRSGLNLDQIFAYLVADDATKPGFDIVFLIDDVKTFEDFLTKSEVNPDLENKSAGSIYGEAKLQWNDKIAVLSNNAPGNGVDVFNEDESKSILANERFISEYSDHNDAYLFIEYNNFVATLMENHPYCEGSGKKSSLSAALDLYKDLSLAITVNAEKGEFVATGKILPAEKATELLGKFYKTDFDNELHNYFSDKSLLAFKFAIKPLDIYNEYISDVAGYDYDAKRFMERYDAKITSVLSNFTGDFLGSLSDITAPDFAIAVGVAEGKENEVATLIKELGFVKKPEGYYLLNQSGLRLYFAVNSKAAYLTGSITAITNFLDNSYYVSNITDADDFGKELENAPNYFYWDLNINHYPSIVKSMLSLSPQGEMFSPLLEKLKSIIVRTINANGSEFKIKFTDNEYASKILLKEIDKWAGQYFTE